MPKKRDKSGEEFWRGKCREQAKEIRQLKKQLRYYQKQEHIFDDQDEELINDSEDTYVDTEKYKPTCLDCGKGKLDTVEFLGRVFSVCPICGERKKIKGP